MKNPIRKFALATVTAALATFGASSHAVLVGSGGVNPYAFSWSQTVTGNDGLQHTLTGNGSMTVSGFNSSSLSIVVTLNNTSAIGGQGGERLTSFGFGIDPNATSASLVDAADGGMIDAQLGAQGSLGSNVQGVEICAWGGVNCNGGSTGGIFGGGSDTFTLVLGGTWGSSVNIDPVGFKYQTGYGSFEFASSTSSSSGGTSGQIPEPASAALAGLGLGLLGLGFMRRRKTAAAA